MDQRKRFVARLVGLFRGEKPADNPAAFSGRELLSSLGTQTTQELLLRPPADNYQLNL